ncbi:hypothetical protein ACE1MS_11855 [Lysinibacillus sp. fkY74-1]
MTQEIVALGEFLRRDDETARKYITEIAKRLKERGINLEFGDKALVLHMLNEDPELILNIAHNIGIFESSVTIGYKEKGSDY